MERLMFAGLEGASYPAGSDLSESIDVVLLDVTLPGIQAERSLKKRSTFDRT
jgi:hypothetical protein